jgi:hypothetical protein
MLQNLLSVPGIGVLIGFSFCILLVVILFLSPFEEPVLLRREGRGMFLDAFNTPQPPSRGEGI